MKKPKPSAKFPIWKAADEAPAEKFELLSDVNDISGKISATLAKLASPKKSETPAERSRRACTGAFASPLL